MSETPEYKYDQIRQHAKSGGRDPKEKRDAVKKLDSGPSVHNESQEKPNIEQLPEDIVEEQSMESFPASDPPGNTGKSTSRGKISHPGVNVHE